MEPNRAESPIGLPHKGRLLDLPQILQVTDSDKNSSILQYGIHYDRKKFYDAVSNIKKIFWYNLRH